MLIQPNHINLGAVFTNGSEFVQVGANQGLRGGLRLDQYPANGFVYVPWFRDEQSIVEFLNLGGHVPGVPFQPIVQ